MSVKIGLKYIELWNESMEEKIREYESEPIVKGQIVFYGPSNFTRWSKEFGMTPLCEAVKGKSGASCVINRGFGSSCAEHQLYYYPRTIRPLEPKVLVYSFTGNNSAFGYSMEESWELAQRVIAYARTDFPDIRIYICGQNPRFKDMTCVQLEEAKRLESWIKAFVSITPNTHYIDVLSYEPLKRKDIYVEDGVHFNRTGYDIYADFFREQLKDELDEF